MHVVESSGSAGVQGELWGAAAASWAEQEARHALRRVSPLLPMSLPSGPGGKALSDPGVLEAMAREAGLTPGPTGDVEFTFAYADDETLVRTMRSAGLIVLAARTSGEDAVRAAILESLAPFRDEGGSYRLENEWHYLIATVS